MKIPFDIKYRPQIESGEYKVETKGGVPVHILSFEALGPCPICYQVGDGMDADFPPRPEVCFANNNGECSYSPNSLFIVTPEEELTEFEKAIKDLVLAIDEGELCELGVFEEENLGTWAVKKAAELLSIAREQFIKDGYVIEKKAFHDAVKKVDPEVMKEVSESIDNTERTEFEQELVNVFNEWNAILPDKDGVYNKRDCEEFLHKGANKLLAIAEKELSAKYKVSSDMNGFAYGKGYEDGKKEAEGNLTEQIAKLIKDFEAHVKNSKTLLSVAFNEGKKEAQEDMKEALRIEYERGKADALKDIPKWRKFAPIINDTLSEQRICQELENSVLRVDVGGYCWIISREELNKLPKENE